MKSWSAGGVEFGAGRLAVIGGPCVIEGDEMCLAVGTALRDACARLGLGYVFKASFDKANRTSIHSFRGPGLQEGARTLRTIRELLQVPVLTDFHESHQAAELAASVDILQVPAFLARQTDLLTAAAATGLAVNVKKGQFMSPGDMRQVVHKLRESGSERILLTERGSSFGYNNLVVDFRSLPQMRELGCPVCFDVTHSQQQPGGLGTASGATREYAPHLARAAVAVGTDALFIEVHPDPPNAKSDAAAQLTVAEAVRLLEQVSLLHRTMSQLGSPG